MIDFEIKDRLAAYWPILYAYTQDRIGPAGYRETCRGTVVW